MLFESDSSKSHSMADMYFQGAVNDYYIYVCDVCDNKISVQESLCDRTSFYCFGNEIESIPPIKYDGKRRSAVIKI